MLSSEDRTRRPAVTCGEFAMRAELVRHFDVVVVVWVLALAIGFSVAMLSHAELSNAQWDPQPHGPAWVVPGD